MPKKKRHRERLEVLPEHQKAVSAASIIENDANLPKFSSGCTVLDCALGGGWVEGRIMNLVGFKSTNKSGLAYEAMGQYRRKYPANRIRYRDKESACDIAYAQTIGMPRDVEFDPDFEMSTVEDFHHDLEVFAEEITEAGEQGGMYVLDSLDPLSDEAEKKRDEENRELRESGKEEKASYGMAKAKKMSEMFRLILDKISKANVTLVIVSQIRDNVNASYGKEWTRAGGKALDHYCSQVVFLKHIGKVDATRNGIKRTIGVSVRAVLDKNKVGMPFREADFDVIFNYGVDDVSACIDWLASVKVDDILGFGEPTKALREFKKMPDQEYFDWSKKLRDFTIQKWAKVEETFLPERRKY